MTKRKKIILIAVLIVIALGLVEVINLFFGIEPPLVIEPDLSIHKYAPTYNVYKNDELVAELQPTPGAVTSAATPPPGGQTPTKNSFLTASSLKPEEENNLYLLLQQAENFDDYINLLKNNGYIIKISHP
ncbi:MAG: hypothetical protein WCT37_03605 [Patescibacteria group bacterium]|jgi:hypothetical protein